VGVADANIIKGKIDAEVFEALRELSSERYLADASGLEASGSATGDEPA
jgi:hypothetical protein